MSSVDDFEKTVQQEVVRLEKLHPTPDDIPGCIKLLDDFLTCNALGSQMRSLYRYGSMASCGQKMEDFKFCMSLKSMSLEDRRDAWIRRRAEWWATRRIGKSSEDVWDVRMGPPPPWPTLDSVSTAPGSTVQ